MARILIIEDNAPTIRLLQEYLAAEGHAVTIAHNGKSGVEQFQSENFDAVITDIFMPVQDGLETIKALRKLDPLARIIAISGGTHSGNADYLRDARQLGANHTLSKPIRKTVLLSALNKILEEPTEAIALTPEPGRETILLAEPLRTVRLSIAHFFSQNEALSPWTLAACGVQEDLVGMLRSCHPVLVVMDEEWYDGEGGEILHHFARETGTRAPAILITRQGNLPRPGAAGRTVLHKPFSAAEFVPALLEAVSKGRPS